MANINHSVFWEYITSPYQDMYGFFVKARLIQLSWIYDI